MKPVDIESYSSPTMRARRKRILEETRKLIAEEGVSGFNLLELCRRAKVAKQTLYYAFKNREGLIAAAILDYFEDYESCIAYRSRPASLERLIERMVAIGQRNLTIPNYVAAITTFYFSQSSQSSLWEALHRITTLPQRAYIEELHRTRQLQAWINPEQLIDALDAQRLGVANEWGQGRVTDEEFIDRTVLNVLTYLLGSVKGAARRQIDETLRALVDGGAVAYVQALENLSVDQGCEAGTAG